MSTREQLAEFIRDGVDTWRTPLEAADAILAAGWTNEAGESRLNAALRRNERLERKAAKANLELEKIRQENARLKLENKIQLGWLNAEESYTRRYKALEARVDIIRDVLSEGFPKKYGQPGAYNWFGKKP